MVPPSDHWSWSIALVPHLCLVQLAHVEPLLLGDIGFKYTVEFRSENEARFPELFQPQVGGWSGGGYREVRLHCACKDSIKCTVAS
jgi:hypothetical protein